MVKCSNCKTVGFFLTTEKCTICHRKWCNNCQKIVYKVWEKSPTNILKIFCSKKCLLKSDSLPVILRRKNIHMVRYIRGREGDHWHGPSECSKQLMIWTMREKESKPIKSQPHLIIKETKTREKVRIPCKYCERLNDITDKKCSSCGASIK